MSQLSPPRSDPTRLQFETAVPTVVHLIRPDVALATVLEHVKTAVALRGLAVESIGSHHIVCTQMEPFPAGLRAVGGVNVGDKRRLLVIRFFETNADAAWRGYEVRDSPGVLACGSAAHSRVSGGAARSQDRLDESDTGGASTQTSQLPTARQVFYQLLNHQIAVTLRDECMFFSSLPKKRPPIPAKVPRTLDAGYIADLNTVFKHEMSKVIETKFRELQPALQHASAAAARVQLTLRRAVALADVEPPPNPKFEFAPLPDVLPIADIDVNLPMREQDDVLHEQLHGGYQGMMQAAISTMESLAQDTLRSWDQQQERTIHAILNSKDARASNETQILQDRFQLPLTEVWLADYACTWLDTALPIQGTMYVSGNFLCFWSNLMGVRKTRVVPIEDVRAISKCNSFFDLVANSIQIRMGEKGSFTVSYVNRDDAFELIKCLMQMSRKGLTKVAMDHTVELRQVYDTFENQRYYPLVGWSSTLLPSDREAWSDMSGFHSRKRSEVVLRDGWRWACEWRIDTHRDVDGEGWEYALDFVQTWHGTPYWSDCVRRRRWMRLAVCPPQPTPPPPPPKADDDDGHMLSQVDQTLDKVQQLLAEHPSQMQEHDQYIQERMAAGLNSFGRNSIDRLPETPENSSPPFIFTAMSSELSTGVSGSETMTTSTTTTATSAVATAVATSSTSTSTSISVTTPSATSAPNHKP